MISGNDNNNNNQCLIVVQCTSHTHDRQKLIKVELNNLRRQIINDANGVYVAVCCTDVCTHTGSKDILLCITVGTTHRSTGNRTPFSICHHFVLLKHIRPFDIFYCLFPFHCRLCFIVSKISYFFFFNPLFGIVFVPVSSLKVIFAHHQQTN